MFLEISKNSQENTCARVFFNKVAGHTHNFQKTWHFVPTGTQTYVQNINFSENFAYVQNGWYLCYYCGNSNIYIKIFRGFLGFFLLFFQLILTDKVKETLQTKIFIITFQIRPSLILLKKRTSLWIFLW